MTRSISAVVLSYCSLEHHFLEINKLASVEFRCLFPKKADLKVQQ